MKKHSVRSLLIKLLLGIAFAAVAFWDLQGLIDYMGFGNHVVIVLCILAFVGGFCLNSSFKWLRSIRVTPFKAIAILLLCCYLSFSATGVESLRKDALYNVFTIKTALNILTTLIWVFPTTTCFLHLYSGFRMERSGGRSYSPKIVLALVFVAMCIEFVLLITALNPAITVRMSYNSLYYARMLGRVAIKEWISPFYYVVLRFLLSICGSVTFIAAVQYFLFIAGVLFVVRFLLLKEVKLRWIILMLAYLMTNISLQIYLVSLFPDSMHYIAILWLTYLLMRMIDEKQKPLKTRYLVCMTLLLVFIGLIRQNGIVISIVCSIIIFCVCFCRKKSVVLMPLITILVIGIFKGPVYDAMRIERTPHEKYLAMTNDILNSYYSGADLSREVEELVYEVTSGDPEAYKYTPFRASYNLDGYNMEALRKYTVGKFLRLYLSNFFSNPRNALSAVLCRTEQIWSLSNAKGSFTVVQYPLNERGDTEKVQEVAQIPERKRNLLTEMFERVFAFVRVTDSILYKIYWRGNFVYNVLLFCVFALLFVRQKGNWDVLILVMPIILSIVSLLVGGGWPDYRYHAPAITVVPIVFIYCGYRMHENNAEKGSDTY